MTRKRVRVVALAVASAVATVATGLAVTAPAQAIPPVGEGQSIVYTYYADATKTVVVGGYSYGTCGNPFDWGGHTAYFTIERITCTIYD